MSPSRSRCGAGPFAAAVFAVVLPLAGCTMASGAPSPTSTTTPTTTTPTTTTPTTTTPARTTATGTTATPASSAPPPYVARVVWDSDARGRILRIYPTASGRAAGVTGATAAAAWREVLRSAADADSPGMRAQFDCHWVYARLIAPDKPSWNLEPWRPVVSDAQMLGARCNPGGADADG